MSNKQKKSRQAEKPAMTVPANGDETSENIEIAEGQTKPSDDEGASPQPEPSEGDTQISDPNEGVEEDDHSEHGNGNTQETSEPTATLQLSSDKIAVVTQFFQGTRDGESVREDFPRGDFIEGALASDAVNYGWARWATPEEMEALKKEISETD